MDNHYVPNLTVGPMVCKSLRDYGIESTIDVHLMISPVDEIIPDFAKAGAPALAKSGIISSTGLIIKWTSMVDSIP